MPSQPVLELQADRIEMILQAHQAPARVTGGTRTARTPHAIRSNLAPAPTTHVNRLQALAEDLALALGTSSAAASRQGDVLHTGAPRVQLLPLCRQLGSIPPFTAVLGLANDGVPLLLRLPSPSVAHVLVTGAANSGKTALAQTMILSLAMTHRRSQLMFVLVDSKQHAFSPLDNLPHLLWPVLVEMNDATDALAELARLVEARAHTQTSSPRIVVVVDELADLIGVGGKSASDSLVRLTQRGREAGVHVIACTQQPSAQSLGSLMRANFPVRLVGQVTSAQDARTATGVGDSGAQHLAGRGDFVAVAAQTLIHFQAAYTTPAELERTVERLGKRTRRWDIERDRGEKEQVDHERHNNE